MKIKFMTATIKLFCLLSLILITPLFSEIERVPIEDRVYGIVHGENVPLRAMPNDKAKVNAKLKNYEFVAVTKIGEGQEEGWIKIYNIPGKEGWVKKDNVEVIDKNNREFMDILNNQCRIGRMLNSISNDKERYLYKIGGIGDFYYVSYRAQDKTGIQLTVDFVRVYKIIDGSFREVAMDNIQKGNICIDKNRMFLYGSQLIAINDIS